MQMEEVIHRKIRTNEIWMHIAEQGTGPLVLLLHGFPEIWYAWRHQLPFLASHGYHVVAPDLRGYGDSDAPLCPSSYTTLHIVGDIIGLLDYFGKQKAFIVGIDWGAVAAWHVSLLRPDRVKGVVCLSVPYVPRDPSTKPTLSFRQSFRDGFYICQFQEPGRAEKAFAKYDTLTAMKKYLLMGKRDNLIAPPGMEIIDCLETALSQLPPWITEEELEVYADKFKDSGFNGPLNYYRAMDLSWEVLAPWQGAKIRVPAKLIIGNKDIGFEALGTRDYIQGCIFNNYVPDVEVVILDGRIQLEKAQEVSDEILSFISIFSLES